MIKILLKITILLSLFLTLSIADTYTYSLRDFAKVVASQNNINILISSEIKENEVLFIFDDKTKIYAFLPAFNKLLFSRGLELVKENGFYYIDKIKTTDNDIKLFTIQLHNFVYPSIKFLLDDMKIHSTYFEQSNTFSFVTSFKNYLAIRDLVKTVDVTSKQLKFKINIFSTNLDLLKDKGFNLSAFAQSNPDTQNASYFLNLITMPYTLQNNLVTTSKLGFYAVLKFLTQKGYTTISNSQILTALNANQVTFSSVKNVPFLSSTVTNSSSSQQVTQNLDYKDVGLQATLTPFITNNNILLKLHLISEDLVSNTNNTPLTNKKEVTSLYKLKRGEILIISGFNSDTTSFTHFGIPFVENIPLVGNIFKYDSKSTNHTILTISIEVL